MNRPTLKSIQVRDEQPNEKRRAATSTTSVFSDENLVNGKRNRNSPADVPRRYQLNQKFSERVNPMP